MEKTIIEIAFKHIPFGVAFEYKEIEYLKTNHMRGYYFKDGKKVLKKFKKSTLVRTSNEFFDWVF